MNIQAFQVQLFEKGEEIGFSEMEIFYSSNKSTIIKVYNREIDEYTIAESSGISFRGIYNGQMGYSYAEKLDNESISLLLHEAKTNSQVLELEDEVDLFEGSKEYAGPRKYSEELANIEPKLLIEAAFEMEKAALELDERVQLVQYCGFNKNAGEILIANTKGLSCHNKGVSVSGGIYLVVNDGDQTATGGEFDFTLDKFSKLDPLKIAKKAVNEAVAKLGADSILTGKYPVIFRGDVASELLGSFIGLFSAESVHKGYSRFKGRLNQQIAGENISLIDDPLMKDAPGYTIFDAEGYATKTNKIIKDGKLQMFMHNRKTAKKDGIESTGNAGKGNYRSPIAIGPHNLYLKPGQETLDELISKTEKGIMIVELEGTNAGINVISGEFSLSAIGFLIEEGKIIRSVNQVTVAGNFFELLHGITAIGNDLDIRGSFTSPSIKVKSLSISGKN